MDIDSDNTMGIAADAVAPPPVCGVSNCIPGDAEGTECILYDKEKCLTNTVYNNFYDAIHWNMLKTFEQYYFNGFALWLETFFVYDNEVITLPSGEMITPNRLFNHVYNTRVVPAAGAGYFQPKSLVTNESSTHCKDINFTFHMPCTGGAGTAIATDLRIFHIALHSIKSRYFQTGDNPTRRQWSCGYFDQPQAGIGHWAQAVFGPFHYKIDNVRFPLNDKKTGKPSKNKCKDKLDENTAPFKRYQHNDGGLLSAMTMTDETGNASRFSNMYTPTACIETFNLYNPDLVPAPSSGASKEEKARQTMLSINYDKHTWRCTDRYNLHNYVETLHEYIYHKFGEYFNSYILPNVNATTLDMYAATDIPRLTVDQQKGMAFISVKPPRYGDITGTHVALILAPGVSGGTSIKRKSRKIRKSRKTKSRRGKSRKSKSHKK